MNTKLSTYSTKKDGNCLYSSIAYALYKSTDDKYIKRLRRIVAGCVTDRTLESYKVHGTQFPNEYGFIREVNNVEQLKQEIMRSKYRFKPRDQVWGDQFAIQSIANALNIEFLIYQTGKSKTGKNKRFTVKPDKDKIPERLRRFKAYIILVLYRKALHYDLVTFEKICIFSDHTLDKEIKDFFSK